MATITKGRLAYAGNVNGVATQILEGVKEGNSQAFKKGDLVNLVNNAIIALAAGAFVTDGTVDTVDISDHTSITTNTTEPQIAGIALRDATNTTTANVVIPVQMLRSGDLLEGNLIEGVNGGSLTDHVSAAADLGDDVALVQDDTVTTNYYFTTTATEPAGKIFRHGLDGGRGIVGDTNIRVQVAIRGDILFFG